MPPPRHTQMGRQVENILPIRGVYKSSITNIQDTFFLNSRTFLYATSHTISSDVILCMLWRCWLADRKGIRPVKTEWWGAGVVICLEQGADLHMAQLMPLPLTVSCFSKIQIGFTFLVPAHPGSPGKRAVKRVCVCVCVLPEPNNFLALEEIVGARRSYDI